MEANTRNLERIFDATITYQIPLFQRPYVWEEEDNWAPLWVDIQTLLDKQIQIGKCHCHFLGAVVFEQLTNATGSIEARQVIDGQQRLTTLQLFLIAARDYCNSLDNDKYSERFTDLTENKASRIDQDTDRFKVWPTNCDREIFANTHQARSPKNILNKAEFPGKLRTGANIPDAYLFFSEKLADWFNTDHVEDNDSVTYSVEDRLEALWQVARSKLQIVVIDLDQDDESQVIFETLNARGTQLLPADLVKNYLFHRANANSDDVESLYEEYWKPFDAAFWREEIRQGRVTKPRIDLFLQHYLSLKTLDDVRVSHLFNTFKHYIEEQLLAQSEPNNNASAELKELAKYGEIFRDFFTSPVDSRLGLFKTRLEAVDTATVYPFLLQTHSQLAIHKPEEFYKVLSVLESFLIRRMMCGLTTKNYNKLFIDLLRHLSSEGSMSAEEVCEYLQSGSGDSLRFPSDEEFRIAFVDTPIYSKLRQYKLNAVLRAIDEALNDNKSETVSLNQKLTIEHLMPQSWHDHWPMEDTQLTDPEDKKELEEMREAKIHTMGNLTLVNSSLNPALSNSNWETKRPEILKFSKLNMTRYFYETPSWNEEEITKRGLHLYQKAVEIWPYS